MGAVIDKEAAGGCGASRTEDETEAAGGCCASGMKDKGRGGAPHCVCVPSHAAWCAFLYSSHLFLPQNVTQAGGLHFVSA